jgi:hypothetical protein
MSAFSPLLSFFECLQRFLARARAGRESQISKLNRVCSFIPDLNSLNLPTAFSTFQNHRRTSFTKNPTVSPLDDGDDHRQKVRASLCKLVAVTLYFGFFLNTLKDPGFNEALQPRRENRLRDAQALLEIRELAEAVKRIAQDQQGPFVADQIDGPGKAAIKLGQRRSAHGERSFP